MAANSKWKRYGALLLDNLDNILAILLCLVAGLYGLFGGKAADAWLLSAITGALGLIAFGTIKDRRAREKLQTLVEGLNKTPKVTGVFKTRNAYRPFEEIIDSAQEVCMVGASLVNLLGLYQAHLTNIIRQHDATVKIIILDESCSAIECAAQCLDTQTKVIQDEIERTEDLVRSIAAACKGSGGSIQLRKMDVFPNIGMTMIDPKKPKGQILIEFSGFKEDPSSRPHIALNQESDPLWFAHYAAEFQRLWAESKEVGPERGRRYL